MKAIDAINTAFTMAGIKAVAQPLDGDMLGWGMTLLRGLVDSWQSDGLYVPFVAEVVQVVNGSPVTIGTGQAINVARPKFVRDGSYFRSGGSDFPVQWLGQQDFNAIAVKSVQSSLPWYGWYDSAVPAGGLHFWPVPTNAELHLVIDAPLPAFADFNITDYAIDTGYIDAITYELACRACLGLKEVPRDLRVQADMAVRKVRANNATVPTLGLPYPLSAYGRRGSWADFVAGV